MMQAGAKFIAGERGQYVKLSAQDVALMVALGKRKRTGATRVRVAK